MKLDITNFGTIMSVFHKVRIDASRPNCQLDAKTWANENAPDHASMGPTFWFKHEEEAVMFSLRFG